MPNSGRTIRPPEGDMPQWAERKHTLAEINTVLGELEERSPVLATEIVRSGDYQTVLGTNAGRIEIWNEAMTIEIDRQMISPPELVDHLRSAMPLAVVFSYEQGRLALRIGAATIRVEPGRPESLIFWFASAGGPDCWTF